ncbi:MAG: GIY-YIG nuclease family protein [Roseiarcus sp.]|jgi:hypothetical protein
MLTASELDFLKSQNLSADDVCDGRNQSATRWKAGVRAAGLTLVLGTACSRGGHRLRTRSGHCAQCDTRNLAYQGRHHSSGYVYIAGSLSAKLLKIGTAIDIEQRKSNLRHQAYGGIHNWDMLFYAKVENGGKVEGEALRLLQRFKITRTYEKDGSLQEASELLQTSFPNAIKALAETIGDSKRENLWKSARWADYDWSAA